MNFCKSVYNLLFDQKRFFEEDAGEGLGVPAILTVIYAVVASIAAIPLLLEAGSLVPAELGGVVIGVGVISGIIGTILSWVVVAAIFFACLKFIGYAECSYKQVLSVCGYVSGILMIGAVLLGLVSLIGSANTIAMLILNGVFLLWSVPVWYFGFSKICDIPEKKLRLAVAVPVLVMVIYSVVTSAGTIFV